MPGSPPAAVARPAIVFCLVALAADPCAACSFSPRFSIAHLLVPTVLILALLALGGAFLGEAPRLGRVGAAAAILYSTAAFDIAAVHDLLTFNRARWTAVDALLGDGVPAGQIDGGYEVDRWLTYRAPVTIDEINTWWNRRDAPEAIVDWGRWQGSRPRAATRSRGGSARTRVVYALRKP